MFGQDYQPPKLPKYADPSAGGIAPVGNDYGAYTPPYLSAPASGNMQYLHGGPALGTLGYGQGDEGAGRAWDTNGPAPAAYNPWQNFGNGPGLGGTTDNPSAGVTPSNGGSFSPLAGATTGAGTGPGGSTPYIGGAGDPNAAPLTGTAGAGSPQGGSTYGPYLGWDQGKLNDPSHNTPKYQFLRAMLDAGINSQNRDLTGAVAALKARGYPVEAVPGSSDQIKWGDQGTYDIFNGTNGDFLFGDVNAAQGGAPAAGMPAGQAVPQPRVAGLSVGPQDPNYDPSRPVALTNSSYGSIADAMKASGISQPQQQNYFNGYGNYQPPYLNNRV